MTPISSISLRLRTRGRSTTWRRILLPRQTRASIRGTSINGRLLASIFKVKVALQSQHLSSQVQWPSKTLIWSLPSMKAWPRWVEARLKTTTTLNCSLISQTCLKNPSKLTSLQIDLRAASAMIIITGVAAAARRNLSSTIMLKTRPSYRWRTTASSTS